MSCIQKLMALKGDKPFLKVKNFHSVIEGGGNYKGYDYLVTFVHHHRCGYVAIPAGHPIDLMPETNEEGLTDYLDNTDLSVHGGITFHSRRKFTDELFDTPCNDKWIGFDAAHYHDGLDFQSADKYEFPVSAIVRECGIHFPETTIKDFNYMENQCKQLINQLIDMET